MGGLLPPILPASRVAFTSRSTGLAHQCTEVLGTPVHWLAFLAHQSFGALWPASPGSGFHQLLVLQATSLGTGTPGWYSTSPLVSDHQFGNPGWALDWPRRGLALRSLCWVPGREQGSKISQGPSCAAWRQPAQIGSGGPLERSQAPATEQDSA